MGRSGGVIVALCFLALGLMVNPALAQPPPQPQADEAKAQRLTDIQLTRVVIQAERQAIVTKVMDLTPEEMQGFWPLYREYRLEMAAVGDRLVALLTGYADSYESLTDAAADRLLTEALSLEQERTRLKGKYLPKFKAVLPPKKVARFYQLENKLDLALLADLAQRIPLVR